ncbi:MAG: terpene cyclase/mutase family protein, partial [Gemmataceae bacterium]|nr:terpene cyclase/mutase family protein [Gemmataceae bacterium]
MSKKQAGEAVIRLVEATEETTQERLVNKHLPAWVVSGGVHVALIALAILVLGFKKENARANTDPLLNTVAENVDEPKDPNLTNDDIGLNSDLPASLPDITRIDQETINAQVTENTVGRPNEAAENTTAEALPGLPSLSPDATAGAPGTTGDIMSGGGGVGGKMAAGLDGRSGATKTRLLAAGGGNDKSEAAVALGLAWLARQQKADGGWVFESGRVEERAAATGMALLPFLAAGVTHRKKENDVLQKNYHENVAKGLAFLMKMCPLNGANAGRMSTDVYANAIAAIPLCEVFGMTKDPAYRSHAQAALNFIMKTQGSNGSWGYGNTGTGDTSIVGWQIQALKAGKLAGLTVDDKVIDRANKFLDLAAAGSRKSMYGYNDNGGAAPGTA